MDWGLVELSAFLICGILIFFLSLVRKFDKSKSYKENIM